jgi:hypothetical protein
MKFELSYIKINNVNNRDKGDAVDATGDPTIF